MNLDYWLTLLFYPNGKIGRKPFIWAYLVIQMLMILSLSVSGKLPEMQEFMQNDESSTLQLAQQLQHPTQHKRVENYQAVKLDDAEDDSFNNFFYVLSMVALNYCVLIISMKRLRDMEKNPWWTLINFLPIVNLFFSIHLAASPGRDEKVK